MLADTTSIIPMVAMYLHAKMFCTLAHTSSIPMGAMYLLLLLLLKKVDSARLGESDIHPISPKTPAPQYQAR